MEAGVLPVCGVRKAPWRRCDTRTIPKEEKASAGVLRGIRPPGWERARSPHQVRKDPRPGDVCSPTTCPHFSKDVVSCVHKALTYVWAAVLAAPILLASSSQQITCRRIVSSLLQVGKPRLKKASILPEQTQPVMERRPALPAPHPGSLACARSEPSSQWETPWGVLGGIPPSQPANSIRI